MSLEGLKGKKLLILAGAGVHSKVVRAAKELGIYTIVTDYLPLDKSPAKLLADEAWMYDIKDVDAIVKRCAEEHVDGVMNFCIDPAQIPYWQICEKLNVPCIGTKEQFNILTNKRNFKNFCLSHNVDVIPDYTENDIKNNNAEYPIFIKPAMSRGSRGQSVCFNKVEAIKAFQFAREESNNGEVVCEKYMGGKQDIASAFFVVNGEPYPVKFGDRYLGKKEDNLDKQVMCTWLPSPFSSLFEKNVLNRVKEMIRALGIKFGPVFMQGFVDGNTIRYYDPAQRMPGGDYDLILKEATGFDTVKSWIHFALTGDYKFKVGNPIDSYKLNNGIGFMITISVRPGLMKKVEGLEIIKQFPHVVYVRQIIPEGSIIPNSGDVKQRVAAVGVYIADRTMAGDLINKIYSTYKVRDENGKDMIVSRYEYRVHEK